MPRVPQYFNFGELGVNIDPELTRVISIMYTTLARGINGVVDPNENFYFNTPQVYTTGAPPSANAQINRNFQIGDIWIDSSAGPNQVYFLTARTTDTAVTWTAVN